MAILPHIRKVGAQPCDTSSSRPVVAPDSQLPPTVRKRKNRIPSPEQQDSTQSQHRHQSKRHRTSESSRGRAIRFAWDSQSRLWLASDALREIDRRNALLAVKTPKGVCEVVFPKDIEHFARHGGPDLSDIRQCSNPLETSTVSDSMPSKPERRSSAYTPNFGQRLVDNGVSLVSRRNRAANHDEWDKVLMQRRPSVSPSRMSDGHYYRFIEAIDGADNEDEVMSHVLPKIVGKPRHPSRQNVQLGNLDPIAERIVIPQPDYYEGELPEPGNRQLREQLDTSIVPCARSHYPFLPNFFAEAKGPDGTGAVAERQACHDGAIGARAMHRVENLGRRGEVFDNKARTASVIYTGKGHIDLFTHHVSQPTGPQNFPRTYMTPLGSYSLAGNPRGFREGVGAFRNASDFARQHRINAIEDAHRRTGIVTPQPLSIAPRPTRTPLSCQAPRPTPTPLTCQDPIVESSHPDISSGPEEESNDGDYGRSSRTRRKGKVPNPKVVAASPKRLAERDLSPPRRELRQGRQGRRI